MALLKKEGIEKGDLSEGFFGYCAFAIKNGPIYTWIAPTPHGRAKFRKFRTLEEVNRDEIDYSNLDENGKPMGVNRPYNNFARFMREFHMDELPQGPTYLASVAIRKLKLDKIFGLRPKLNLIGPRPCQENELDELHPKGTLNRKLVDKIGPCLVNYAYVYNPTSNKTLAEQQHRFLIRREADIRKHGSTWRSDLWGVGQFLKNKLVYRRKSS